MRFIQPGDDGWQAWPAESSLPPPLSGDSRWLLNIEQWLAVRDAWPDGTPVGVAIPNTADVEELAQDLPRLSAIALQFPKWVDGRAYSQAHVLRARLRYAGEIRATGDVVVDMLPLLRRTGFDAVQLRDGQLEATARRTLTHFKEHYQGDVAQIRPLFSRVPA